MGACRLVGLDKADRWLAKRLPGEGGDLPGQPDHRERVTPIGLDVHVEHDLAEDRAEVGPEGILICAQDLDPVRVASEIEFARRAEHAVAHHPADLGALDAPISGQRRARQRHRDQLPRSDVLCAAHDLQRGPALLGEDLGHPQRVGVRMTADLENAANHDVAPLRAAYLDRGHLHPAHGELLAQLIRAQLDVDVLREPGERDAHFSDPR